MAHLKDRVGTSGAKHSNDVAAPMVGQAPVINKRMAASNLSTERPRSGMTQRIGDTLNAGVTK